LQLSIDSVWVYDYNLEQWTVEKTLTDHWGGDVPPALGNLDLVNGIDSIEYVDAWRSFIFTKGNAIWVQNIDTNSWSVKTIRQNWIDSQTPMPPRVGENDLVDGFDSMVHDSARDRWIFTKGNAIWIYNSASKTWSTHKTISEFYSNNPPRAVNGQSLLDGIDSMTYYRDSLVFTKGDSMSMSKLPDSLEEI